MNKMSRIEREKQTVGLLIKLYCHDKHHPHEELCRDCQILFDYAQQRLDHCKFGEDKTVCGDCTVHCYKIEMREKIISIMRYSGPRILFHHPIVAIQHLIDKKAHPPKKNN
ncbi:nitrous oxide-stimulated promoter family protein [Desulfitobacterium metallireducens]|uniref:Nitrous oxide-stimulated promoter n=1 Tax=Desulfitobacterium metallireducens DSM 15288 TaxID=871968 RepID=W0EA73_9FIRM|nr:nitrous oxide-stimulated promoter family protein [Desulfitobacterium metallireducens]AHF05961.1 Nitrous oxide-stimulated promoter [Desulfitobacterium metallireducens DSM 15288]